MAEPGTDTPEGELMDAVMGNIITGVVVAALGLAGTWIVSRVQRKAANTQEQSSVAAQWQAWATEQRIERDAERAARIAMKEQVDNLENEVRSLRDQVSEVKGLFNTAIRHIRELRAFIVSLGAHDRLPLLPADIAHLIEEKNK